MGGKYERPTLTMSHDLLPIAPLTGQFAINFYLIGAEIIASCPHIIVAVWHEVWAARETRIIISICVVCNINIMSRTEGRTIIVIAVCSVITIGNVPFKISRSLIVFERKYESLWWRNVASVITRIVPVVPWKKAHTVDKDYPLIQMKYLLCSCKSLNLSNFITCFIYQSAKWMSHNIKVRVVKISPALIFVFFRARAILFVLKNYSCLFIPNCTRSRVDNLSYLV